MLMAPQIPLRGWAWHKRVSTMAIIATLITQAVVITWITILATSSTVVLVIVGLVPPLVLVLVIPSFVVVLLLLIAIWTYPCIIIIVEHNPLVLDCRLYPIPNLAKAYPLECNSVFQFTDIVRCFTSRWLFLCRSCHAFSFLFSGLRIHRLRVGC